MTTLQAAKELALSLAEEESRSMIDDDIVLRIALFAARTVGAEITRKRIEAEKK